jgi:hypothetical protein
MTSAQIYMHAVNLGFFICAAILWFFVLKRIFLFRFPIVFRLVGAVTAITAIILCLVFLVLQWDWIVSGHNEAVGNVTSYLWLIFDYSLAIFMLLLGSWVLLNINLVAECCDTFLVPK